MHLIRAVILTLVVSFLIFPVANATSATIDPANYTIDGITLNQMLEDRYFRAPNGMTEKQIQVFFDQRKSILAGLIPIYRLTPSNQLVHTGLTVRPSRLIYLAQRTYSIHAALILTLLQKEQGLLRTLPGIVPFTSRAFMFAMGYGAMDSGDLLNMSGFDRQIDLAAKQLRKLFDASTITYPHRMTIHGGKWLVAGGIVYPPMIHVRNRATNVLFRYTPWAIDPKFFPTLSGGNLLFMKVFRREFQS